MATATRTNNSNGKSDHAEMGDIEEQIARLSEDVKALTGIVADYGSGKFDEAKSRASERSSELRARSARGLQAASKQFSEVEGEFENQIKANPLAAIGIAAGVGFLVAMITKR